MCEYFHTFGQITTLMLSVQHMLFVLRHKRTILIQLKAIHTLGCPLMLRINNRCVALLNISVEVAKCGKFSHMATSILMLSDSTHLLFVLGIRGHPYELEHYHEQIVQTRRVIFCNRQKWVLWMNLWIFSTFGDITLMLSDSTHLLFVLSIRGHTN